jgi:hypothetical protein
VHGHTVLLVVLIAVGVIMTVNGSLGLITR